MTREELNQNTAFIFNNAAGAAPIGIKLYFVLEQESETQIRFADISAEVATDLKKQFVEYLEGKLANNPELNYAAITEADDTSNSIYHYNLDEQPKELQPLYDVQSEEIFSLNQAEHPSFPKFTFNQDDLSKITGFVICLGNEANKVVLYKKHYHVSLMKRGSYYGLLAVQSATRFEKLIDNVIKLNNTIEFMLVGEELVVFSLKIFQNSFGYDKIIRSKAEENLETIAGAKLLDDIEVLRELVTELKFAKKIMNIRHHSPVLHIPFADVRTFIKGHPKLKRKIKFNADQTRISLQSRSSKELFIKILNDDFLKSELTQLLYDSQKKAAMDSSEEPEEA
jgi:hypothetical protein